jgi:hypothetical protein
MYLVYISMLMTRGLFIFVMRCIVCLTYAVYSVHTIRKRTTVYNCIRLTYMQKIVGRGSCTAAVTEHVVYAHIKYTQNRVLEATGKQQSDVDKLLREFKSLFLEDTMFIENMIGDGLALFNNK